MASMNPSKTGVTLAVTLAISYSACAIAYALVPERGIDFLNALFHGLDFRKLASAGSFTFMMFVYPLLVFVVWGFVIGALYAWLHNFFHGVGNR